MFTKDSRKISCEKYFKHSQTELFFDGVKDRIAVSQPTRSSGANLNVIFADRVSDKHRVKGGHFVNSHFGHADYISYLVHGRNWQPSLI